MSLDGQPRHEGRPAIAIRNEDCHILSEKRPAVLISGYYGFRNAGDEAILAGMLASLRAERNDLDFVVVSNDPMDTQSNHEVRAVHWQDMAGLAAAAESSSLILVGGGGLFQDYWGLDPASFLTQLQGGISHYGGSVLLAALLEKPCMIYGVGVGPVRSAEARRWTRWLFELADVVTVRDKPSKETLLELGYQGDGILITADPAFGVDIKSIEDVGSPPELVGLSRPVVGVSLRYWPAGDESTALKWIEQVVRGLEDFLDQTGGSILFIPFQDGSIELENDLEVSRRARNLMTRSDRSAVASGSWTPLQRYGLVGRCDLVLGMRLHATIAAVQASVPYVGIAYDPKVINFMERVGLANLALPLEGIESGEVARALHEAHGRRALIGEHSDRVTIEMRALAARSAKLAVNLMVEFPRRVSQQQPLRLYALSQIKNLAAAEREIESQSKKIESLSDALMETRATVDNMSASRGWALIRAVRLLKQSVRSPLFAFRSILAKSWRGKLGNRRLTFAMGRVVRAVFRILRPTGLYTLYLASRASRYEAVDRSHVVLYAQSDELLPDYSPREQIYGRSLRREPVSLVVTLKDEAGNLQEWLQGLLGQSRMPDEVIIVDGGSRDDSQAILQDFSEAHKAWFRVIVDSGANIARGRNLGIAAAKFPTIAVTDVGSDMDRHWLERLMAPFEADESVEVVAGGFAASSSTRLGRAAMKWLVPSMEAINPQSFIPSSRSLAFRKRSWEAVGGYPEWLTLTGEDTYFSLELKRVCKKWAVVPEAVVTWHAPTGLRSFFRKASSWASGDGEAGLFIGQHFQNIAFLFGVGGTIIMAGLVISILLTVGFRFDQPSATVTVIALFLVALTAAYGARRWSRSSLLWGILDRASRAYGFSRGLTRRPMVTARHRKGVRGLFLMLAGVPIEDTGGGSRSAQLSQELLRRGFLVQYVHGFPSYESRDLGLAIRHPALQSSSLYRFDWEAFVWEHGLLLNNKPLTAVVEFPLPEFLSISREVKRTGGKVIYDLLDNWQTSLGAGWYSSEVEQEIIDLSDVLIATAPTLVRRLEEMSQRAVEFLPNAVNLQVFNREIPHPRPTDMPLGKPTVIYVGALWGEWFDWDLLRAIAHRCPGANIVLVGDYRGQFQYPPINISFLGLKPQTEIPAFLAHSDVAIIPWKVSPITHATSPLKVYEYLAMGLPVVAPRLDALSGIPGVEMVDSVEDFVEAVARYLASHDQESSLDSFVRLNSWEARVSELLTLARSGDPEESKAPGIGPDEIRARSAV